MSKGRPKKKEKRTVIVKVRLTEEEADVLETASKILKITKSDLLREQIVSLRTRVYMHHILQSFAYKDIENGGSK